MAEATSFRRGLALLMALGHEDAIAAHGYGVTTLSQLSGMDKGQVSRMLRVLDDAGLVERDPQTRTYRLGWALYAMAARAGDQRLLDLAPPVLQRLVDEVGERSHLSVLRGNDVLTVLTRSPGRAVQTAGWIGRPVPAHCTSSGRVLLLDRDLPDLARFFAGVPFEAGGGGGPTDVADLHARILVARLQGYAIVDEEFEVGLVAAAAPVRDARGRIVAALNVSAPKFRFADHLTDAAVAIKSAADDLSRQLGWTDTLPTTRSSA
jgi:DNA-binding IclR family transcriptional regulator